MLLLVLVLGCGLFYILEQLIHNLPSSYEARPGSAQPGLDGEAWSRVQKVVDKERSSMTEKVDKVAADMATTRQRQTELEGRMVKLAAESSDIKSLSDQLRDKLSVLELERTAAYTAASKCEKRVSQCAKPHDVEKLCVLDQKEGAGVAASLRGILADEQGPLQRAVRGLVKDAQDKDDGCATEAYIDEKWAQHMRKQSQDDVGMRDYALADMGGLVVPGLPYTSPAFTAAGSFLSTDSKKRFLGMGRDVGGPGDAISKGRNKGDCFAFNGQTGFLTVRLSEVVPAVGAVTVEHLNKVFSEQAGDSAPKAFKVFGFANASVLERALHPLPRPAEAATEPTATTTTPEGDGAAAERHSLSASSWAHKHAIESGAVLLLEGAYDINKESPIQVFNAVKASSSSTSLPVAFVRLEVVSNHGNDEYTCVYRFRVHAAE